MNIFQNTISRKKDSVAILPRFVIFYCLVFLFSSSFPGISQATEADKTGINTEINTLLLSVKELIALQKINPATIIVDVRSPGQFQELHIPQSINIQLPFVKTKNYLKNMKVILVNQGYNQNELREAAIVLQEKGFDIGILNGGLASWHQMGEKFNGENKSMVEQFHLLPPELFLAAKELSNINLSIDISPELNQELNEGFPGSLHVPVHDKNDIPKLIEIIEAQSPEKHASVLLFNIDGQYYASDIISQLSDIPLFFLKGGLQGYQLAMTRHQAMWLPRDERLKKVGGCATCPETNDKETAQ
jgi:rhodanese-related sulfurtransferase